MQILKKLFPYLLILVLSFIAIKPLLAPGFFPMHDDTQVTRVFEMSKALRDGMFPVRWSMDLGFGYGYPIFNFYAPLSYYVGGFINLIGVNALDSTKIMMGIGILLSGIFMYLFSKDFFGKAGGILSALLYVYAPYHAVDIFVRGDVSEFFAYAFIPLLFYGLYQIHKTNNIKYSPVASLGFAAIVLSHNLTALMVTPFALIFTFVLIYKNKKSLYKFIVSYILGLMLSAFYFIPALLEMGYTNVISQIGGGADFKDHFVCLNQLWTSSWGYGGSASGCTDGISFMIGKYHIIFSLVVIVALLIHIFYKTIFKESENEKNNSWVILLFSVFALISVFLMLDSSSFIWQLIKPMEFLQYPWRFLLVTSFCLAFLGGGFLWIISKYIKGKWFLVSCVILFIGVVLVNMKFFVPQKVTHQSLDYYTSRKSIEWNISKISSEYMPKYFPKPLDDYAIADHFHIHNETTFKRNTNSMFFDVTLERSREIIASLAYFPAWQVFVDNEKVPVSSDSKYIGMVKFPVGIGKHNVYINFVETPIEHASDLVSIAGLLALFAGIIYFRKNNDKV